MQWWRARSLAVSKWCLPRSSCRVVAVFRDASTAERHHKGPSASVEVPFKAGHAMSGDDERQGLLTTGANRKANPFESGSMFDKFSGRASRVTGLLVSALALFSAGAAVHANTPGVRAGVGAGVFVFGMGRQSGRTPRGARLGSDYQLFDGEITTTSDSSVPPLGTQPSLTLTSWDPAHVGLVRFNACKTDDPKHEELMWSVGNVKPGCRVDAERCVFCAWVLQFDSEYRVNDIVTCLGPTYKQAAEAVVNEPKFKGTVLERMLAAKGTRADGTIDWYEDHFQEAKDNFRWMVAAIGHRACDVPDHATLVVHIRAGDNLNDTFKSIPHIQAAIAQMKQYLENRPYITRIELSSVLHFGVPAPDSRFAYNDGVGDAYLMTDDALRKNGLILGHFYEAALTTGRDVWFTSTNDPDDDMCRYAKACHFLSASLSKEEMVNEGPMEQRLSFSELVRDLHMHLSTCDARDTAEWAPETGGGVAAAIREGEQAAKPVVRESSSSVLSRLLGHNAGVRWRE